jgi:hypothetical protein
MADPDEICQCGHTYGQHEWMDDALYGYCSKCDCHQFIPDHDDEPEEFYLWGSQDAALADRAAPSYTKQKNVNGE